MKWIQEKFNGLSQKALVKNVQICHSRPLSTFQVINGATKGVDVILTELGTRHLYLSDDIL
jgi:hypothetical protein